MDTNFFGPFEVIEIPSEQNVRIKRGNKIQLLSRNMVVPHRIRQESETVSDEPNDSIEAGAVDVDKKLSSTSISDGY